MGTLIKYLFYIIILAVIGLVGYSFFGDLSPPTVDHNETINLGSG